MNAVQKTYTVTELHNKYTAQLTSEYSSLPMAEHQKAIAAYKVDYSQVTTINDVIYIIAKKMTIAEMHETEINLR